MSIFVDENTQVIVQGLTGSQGRFHGLRNRDYGTRVVGGVTPGKGGSDVDGIAVFNSVKEAVEATGASASFVVVPPKFALTYQALYELSQQGIGQTTCVGIGGDPVPGTNFIDCLSAFEADPETRAVMMIGSYIAGVTAPPGRKMGHAGAIISGSKGTAQAKMDALSAAGVHVCQNPTEAGQKMGEIVKAL